MNRPELVKRGHEALTTVAQPAKEGANIYPLVEVMRSEMAKWGGIGLACNQLGITDCRLIAVKSRGVKFVLENPEVEPIGKAMQASKEGCLSFPGLNVTVARHLKIRVTGTVPNEEGAYIPFSMKLKGLESAIVQHEVDHLNGIILPDHEQGRSKANEQ